MEDKQSRKQDALESILCISKTISSKLNIDDLLQLIVDEVVGLLGTSSCSILLPNENTGEMIFHAAVDPIVGMRVPLGKGIVSTVFMNGIPKIVNDLSSNKEYFSDIEISLGKPIHALLAVPLIVENRVIGVIEAVHDRKEVFTTSDQNLLVTLAGYAAIAIENARLYKDIQDQASSNDNLVVERTKELKELYERVKKLSVTDDLTGIYNRRGLYVIGKREIHRTNRYGHNLSVIMFDLDDFKEINDNHGHIVGDQILFNVAHQCQTLIREMDIIGRYGGDEFIIILPETSRDEAQTTAERIQDHLANSFIETENGKLGTTISIGITVANTDIKSFRDLINTADLAMYSAKRAGKNCIWMFTEQLNLTEQNK
jgi:diguanylate cyclase (GGDEF)-like protein